ncbi:GNAT family N-acetyltransferase [Methylobacterium sp. 77]|uniref:GNAT family N-acetyltransferase n=1 Tax=Methylobacterium sp. 77 TaxID=1101192 RepID=UPI00037819BD|nr:GNAT family N-acetyltransferase [Methylobacterium sp. 77]
MNAFAHPGKAVAERLEIVRSPERLAAVETAWTDLWQRAGGLVFQSHAWIQAWWTTAPDRERRALLIVLAWRGDRLEAVLPLATCRRRGVLLLEWAAKDHADYGDALLAPGDDSAVIGRMWEHLLAAGGFDLIYVNRMLPNAKIRALLGPAQREAAGLHPNHRSEASSRVVGSWRSGQEWFDGQSKKMRQNYRRGQKFLSEQGPLRFRLVGPDESIEPILERLAALKRKWLDGRALESALFDEGTPALPALVRVLAETGLLHLFVLECDGVVIAVSVNFVQAGSMMAFVTTYDPDFERGSPGMVLMMDYIQWSIDHGYRTIDFLCGDESFKGRFATETVTLDSVMGSRTLLGAGAMMADTCQHEIKSLRGQVTNKIMDSHVMLSYGLDSTLAFGLAI